MLQKIVDSSLLNLMFTTDDLDDFQSTAGPANWPSPAQLLAMGKRVVIFNDAEDRSGLEHCDGCKPPLQFQMREYWGKPTLSGFDGPPNCMGKYSNRSAEMLLRMRQDSNDAEKVRAFYRVQGDATGYPLINRPVGPVQLDATTARKVMACGMWPQFDLLDEKRAAATRWSFAEESVSTTLRSTAPTGQKRCAVILGGDDLRWYLEPCHSPQPRRCACRDLVGGGWSLASPHQCPDGDCDDGDGEDCRAACVTRSGVFACPRTAVEMHSLAAAIDVADLPARSNAGVEETVWLNAVEHCSGCWSFNELQETPGSTRKLHCLPPINVTDGEVRHSCLAGASSVHGSNGCATGGTGCATKRRWMGLSSNFTTFIGIGLGVAVSSPSLPATASPTSPRSTVQANSRTICADSAGCNEQVCMSCAYRRSVYIASSSPLKERLNQDDGLEMDVFATNTTTSSNESTFTVGESWDLPGGGYTSPGGF